MKKESLVLLVFALIVFSGFFLRFYQLDSFLLHHDEGVNGFFSTGLFYNHSYHYNPQNYHGPSLYYFTMIPFAIFGVSDFSLRFIPALFGALLVLLVLPLRRHFGNVFFLSASAFLAFSPTLVYYSRDAIHEMLFVFFTLSSLVFFYLYFKERKPLQLFAFSASLALMLATKETGFLFLGIFAFFALVLWLLKSRFHWKKRDLKFGRQELLFFIAIFLIIYIALFSSFFSDLDGVRRSLIAPFAYSSNGMLLEKHVKPFAYFFEIFLSVEPLLFLLSIAAAVFFMLRRSITGIFLSFWFVAMFFLHSISPYKTPWLIVSITLPMAFLSAFFLQKVWGRKTRLAVSALVIAIIALSVFNVWQSSFLHVNQDGVNKLSYVHTSNDARNLLSFLDGKSKEKSIVLQVENYSQWPLPWYFSLKKYHIERDQNLFSLLRQARSECGSGSGCSAAVLKVHERLEELGRPFILGGKTELGFLDANSFELKDFELRKNYWIRLASARQEAG